MTIKDSTKCGQPSLFSDRALACWKQRRERPAMLSDWDRTVMLHYAVDPDELQPQVPFILDTHEGTAYVSLVAFTLRRLRPGITLHRRIPWVHALLRPVSEHGFLNVRTYVRHAGRTGIYFLAEWLPNRLSILLGPRMYGLPYRYGKLDYRHQPEHGELQGTVEPTDESARLHYRHHGQVTGNYHAAQIATLDEFLLERYTAFTQRGQVQRFFDVWHHPWQAARIEMDVQDDSLLGTTGPWFRDARYALSHYSPGVTNVWLGRPYRLKETRDAA